MVKVGIDAIAIYTSRYALDLTLLAKARGVAVDKYRVGLGQEAMAVAPPGEDIVTMAGNAALQVVKEADKSAIEMLLFATESGIDQSKAAGLYLHDLLDLHPRCRVVELKQACYSATAALQLALPYLREHPNKKILLIASDIARYGLNTVGESSQGNAAVAILLTANPRIIAFENEYGVVTENVMDFWRPNYLHEALVDGKFSSKLYLMMLEKSWSEYQTLSQRDFNDHTFFCYHTPVPRLVEKAHQYLTKINHCDDLSEADKANQIQHSLIYGRKIGNSYTASLYVSLASLLDLAAGDLQGTRIGFYSYGSGCVAEYFSGIVQKGYQAALNTHYHANLFANRQFISYEEYESFYQFQYVEDGSDQELPHYQTGEFRLAKLSQHKRIYEKIATTQVAKKPNCRSSESLHPADESRARLSGMKVFAPGKLILSGEHSVLYGSPALAIAINRYAMATVTRESLPQVLFDLADLAHHSRLTFNALRHLKDRVKRKYYGFIRGDFSIRDVLQKPFELAQFALSILADSFNLSLPHGVKIHVQSDIPMGCGMGSSAATILSVMQAIANYLRLPLSQETLFKLALEAENMQHGRSSGLDLQVALNGGCLYMHHQSLEKRALPTFPMYLVNTGIPQATTGQCVKKVTPYFKSGSLSADFSAVTAAMDQAITTSSLQNIHAAIRQNHRLLVKIGVVPEKVQQFINEIESLHGSAKICGAGSVLGEQAGAVLVVSDSKESIITSSKKFGYKVIPITTATRGVYAA